MPNTSVTIDNTKVFELIEKMIARMERPEPLLTVIGKYIQAQTRKMFIGRPDNHPVRGESWEPLKKSTILKKLRKKTGIASGGKANFRFAGASHVSRPLVDSGLLRDDLMAPRAIKVRNKGLTFGTERKSQRGFLYPAIHQVGYSPNNLPKRRWLFLTEFEIFQIGKTVVKWLDGYKIRPSDFEGDV